MSEDKWKQRFAKKVRQGDVDFRAEVHSPEGSEFGIEILPDSVPGQAIDEPTWISLNTGRGKVQEGEVVPSKVMASIPQKGPRIARIDAEGNAGASIAGIGESLDPKIRGNKKLKASNEKGLYAVATVKLQRDTGKRFFDLIFGLKGEPETIVEGKGKTRAHLALHPSGSGKFFRLAGFACEILSRMEYDIEERSVVPKQLKVKCSVTDELLHLNFSVDKTEKICFLEEMNFQTEFDGN